MTAGGNQAAEQPTNTTSTSSSSIKVLGVCGGIGSGKSMACQLLVSDLGCIAHIESDSIAHSVYQPGSQAIQDVVSLFGTDILLPDKPKGQEEIDRKKLGAIVFGDPQKMKALEHIVWPHVKTKVLQRIQEIKDQHQQQESSSSSSPQNPVIILESAVLLDAGWDSILDGIWVVRVPRELAIQRLMEFRAFSKQDAEQRMDAQQSRRGIGNLETEVKNGIVTAVIENTGDLDALKASLLEKLQDSSSWKKQ